VRIVFDGTEGDRAAVNVQDETRARGNGTRGRESRGRGTRGRESRERGTHGRKSRERGTRGRGTQRERTPRCETAENATRWRRNADGRGDGQKRELPEDDDRRDEYERKKIAPFRRSRRRVKLVLQERHIRHPRPVQVYGQNDSAPANGHRYFTE